MSEDTQQTNLNFDRVDPFKIRFNPDNPRGQKVAETDRHLLSLEESVREFGVLVPLVVVEERYNDYEYLLVDGERRLLAARHAGLEKVPVLILRSPFSEESLRKTMFHIHRHREAWKAPAECEALEPLYEELLAKYQNSDDPQFLEEFIDRTGYYSLTAQDRLRFLRWPRHLRERVLGGDVHYWYVVEVEKLIEPAKKNFPEYVNDATVDRIRAMLLEKSVKGVVGPAVAVREAGVIARTALRCEDRDKALAILKDLVEQPMMSFEEARDRYLRAFPDLEVPPRRKPVALANEVSRLANALRDYDEQFIVSGVGRSKVDVDSFVQAMDELSEVLDDLRDRVRAAARQADT